LARVDPDGLRYITGRKQRFLKVYGNRLNLDELDKLLKAEGHICASTGTDDHVAVFVQAAAGRPDEQNSAEKSPAPAGNQELASQVQALLVQKTGLNKEAFCVKILPELPRNEAGKVLYAQLQAQLDKQC